MNFSNPYTVALVSGLATLYYGVDLFVEEGLTISSGTSLLLGLAGSFYALSNWGDERSQHTQYQNRPKNPTHIASIPRGDSHPQIGENHGTTVMNEEVTVEIRDLVESGRIMDALRVYRQITGHNLRESKDYINSVIQELEQEARSK